MRPCGCCEGVEPVTPVQIENRPGLPAIAYRVGTHASFLSTMLARLSELQLELPGVRPDGRPVNESIAPMRGLTTRSPSDASIALLDAWATVADVLAFYQERIANQGFLRTATERYSILQLGRMVGYELRPGVSASVYLAFTLEEGYEVVIPAGTAAKSTPGPNQLPQTFETSDAVAARAEWNTLKPRLTRPQVVVEDADCVYMLGVVTGIQPGDPVLLVLGDQVGKQHPRWAASVEPDAAHNWTKVCFQERPQVVVDGQRLSQALKSFGSPTAIQNLGTSKVAQASIAVVAELQSAIDARDEPPVLGRTVEHALAQLEELLVAARSRHLKNDLVTWLTGFIGALHQMLEGTSASTRPATQPDDRTPIQRLLDLVDPLTRPPALNPPDSRQAARSVESSLALQTDAMPQLIAALRPGIDRSLYEAWATVAEVPAAGEVHALLAKASVFGHNAPLKAITDRTGVVIGLEEWPLAAPVTITIEATFTQGIDPGGGTYAFTVSISRQGRLATNSLKPGAQDAGPWSLQVGDVMVAVSVKSLGELLRATVFDFSPTVKRQIWLGRDLGPDAWAMDEGVFLAVQTGKTETRIGPGHTAAVDHDPQAPRLTVVDTGPDALTDDQRRSVQLDNVYSQITPGTWAVITRAGQAGSPFVGRVVTVEQTSLAEFGITGRSTVIKFASRWLQDPDPVYLSAIRGATIYLFGPSVPLAEAPIDDDVSGCSIELGRLYAGLDSGRWMIVAGERTDAPGVQASEVVMLDRVEQGVDETLPGDVVHSTLELVQCLSYRYRRETVTVYGNVAHATHGETHSSEVLGSGDASQGSQAFSLKFSPLTYVSADAPNGMASTLQARVNDLLWRPRPTLLFEGPAAHSYVARADDQAVTTVSFGDGIHGARLPTGSENVRATYRSGIGKPGNVASGRINQLATRPLGVKATINPLDATGGADPDTRDQARSNIPLSVTALDRLVSVKDYADFARMFTGIGKATAQRVLTELPAGPTPVSRSPHSRLQVVLVTVAGVDDIPIAATSDLFRNLSRALHDFGDPLLPVRLRVRRRVVPVIQADVRIAPDYLWSSTDPAVHGVEERVRQALLDAFGFERMEIGESLALSAVISTIQSVAGVVHLEVKVFDRVSEDLHDLGQAGQQKTPPAWLVCQTDELAYLSPDLPATLILNQEAS